jgi:CHAD domain-containing protein
MLDRDWVDDLRAELDRYGELLGAVRDLDVLIGHLWTEGRMAGGEADTGELLAPLELERDEARVELRTAMGSQRYRALLERLESAVRYLPVTRTDLSVEKLVRRELRRLRKFKRRANLDDDRQLHKLRILGKRARYAAELAEGSRSSRATKFIAAATKLQDTLGEHQDAVVAIRRLRTLALLEDCETAFLAGRLAEREEGRKREARDAFPAVWKRVEKRGRAAW